MAFISSQGKRDVKKALYYIRKVERFISNQAAEVASPGGAVEKLLRNVFAVAKQAKTQEYEEKLHLLRTPGLGTSKTLLHKTLINR